MKFQAGETDVNYSHVPIVRWGERRYTMAPYIAVTSREAIFFADDRGDNPGTVINEATLPVPLNQFIGCRVSIKARHKLVADTNRKQLI